APLAQSSPGHSPCQRAGTPFRRMVEGRLCTRLLALRNGRGNAGALQGLDAWWQLVGGGMGGLRDCEGRGNRDWRRGTALAGDGARRSALVRQTILSSRTSEASVGIC